MSDGSRCPIALPCISHFSKAKAQKKTITVSLTIKLSVAIIGNRWHRRSGLDALYLHDYG